MTVEEVNMILRTLGKHPFEDVVALINKIKQQGEPQVAAMAEAEAKNKESNTAEETK
jgi:hypothetical protein